MRRFKLLPHLGLSTLLLLLSSQAHAKSVHLEWKAIPHAAQYEITIEKQGKPVFHRLVSKTQWTGDLPFGIYSYQIRALDKVKRPGDWSTPHALVVMSDAPKAIQSGDDKEKTFFTPKTQTILRWKATETANRYSIEVKREGTVIYRGTVNGTELRLDSLKAGRYTWQVAAVVEANGREPASFAGRQWESKPSEPVEFVLIHESLPAPKQISPLGNFKPPAGGKLHLSWSHVDGAQAYEVIVSKMASMNRGPASTIAAATSKFITRNDSLNIRVTGEGSYVWQVRAIASISEQKDPDSYGAKSIAVFALDRNAIYEPHTGSIMFKALFAPYTYQVSSPQTGGSGLSASSVSTTVGISGDYWPERQWGYGMGFEDRMFTMGGQSFSDPEFRFAGKYRVTLDGGNLPWALYPEAGLELRQYTYVLPSQSGTGIANSQNFMTAGPVGGVELRKQFTEKFSLGGKVLYYLPVSGGTSSSNMSAGLQGFYWLNPRWAAGAGIFVEDRAITHTASGGTENIQMNGSYFFGSLVWTFGR